MPSENDMVSMEHLRATMLKKLVEKINLSIEVADDLMASCTIEMQRRHIEERAATEFAFTMYHTILAGRPMKKKASTVRVPVSWWDHFLDRLLPKGASRLRRKIRYRIIETNVTIYNVCPHIAVRARDDIVPHLNFVYSVPDGIYYPEYWKIH